MKTYINIFLLLLFCNSFAQVSENFDTNFGGSYGDYTNIGSGSDFDLTNGLSESSKSRSGRAVRFRNSGSPMLNYTGADDNGKDGGLGVISFWYRHWDGDSNTPKFQVEYSADSGSSWTSIGSEISVTSTTYSEFSHAANISGDNILVRIRITNTSERIIIDDFSISNYAGGAADPEPTNQPTGLSASATHEKITLTWTDSETGSQAPAKYLIIGETDSSINNPVDGTLIGDDTDASDSRISINVNHGVGTASFSNVGNATWYFEIFPYTNSGSDINYKTDGTIQTDNITTNSILITEIVYNSPGTDWEWVELYNPTASTIDISGYTIIDNYPNTMITFPASTSISATSYFTVVVSGSGTAQFNADYDPGAGNYVGGLNNGGDSVILKDSSNNIVDQVDYDEDSPWPTGADGTYYSLELISGSNNYYAASWQASYAEYGSPGIKTSTAWNNSLGSSDDLTVSSPDNIVISADRSINNITINSGANLTIEKSGSLTVAGNLTNNGSVILQSDSNEFSAIKVAGTPTGDITYKRYVNTVGSDEWDLIGTPVGGDNYISTFVSANSGSLATNGSSPTTYAIGYYNNSSNSWANYDSSSVVDNSTAFEPGKGYQMAHSSGGTLSFTGSIPSSSVTEPVIDNSSSGRRWNLVSNPYPSYLNLNSAADGTNNFLDINTDAGNQNIDDNFKSVYGWNPNKSGGAGYESYDFNDTAKYIAPGQGFFIAASSSSSTDLDFTQAMQTVTGGDDFVVGDPVQYEEIYLNLYNVDLLIEQTHIRFRENMTFGLNPGYDVGNFNQNAAITTRLLEDDEGVNFEHQNLPLSAMENAVIPLVINQVAGQEFRINLHTATIPNPNIYLEDVEEGTFTNLYEGDFVYTPTSDLSGAGRFFIHMTADTMSNEEVSTSMLNAYKEIDASYITIEGLATQSNETKVSLYNILGREVLSTTLNNNIGTQTISTVGLSVGIYVIELESGNDRLTKKLLIQ